MRQLGKKKIKKKNGEDIKMLPDSRVQITSPDVFHCLWKEIPTFFLWNWRKFFR